MCPAHKYSLYLPIPCYSPVRWLLSLPAAEGLHSPFLPVLQISTAWCLRNEGVNSVLLGASRIDQLMENLRAIQVRKHTGRRWNHFVNSSITTANIKWHQTDLGQKLLSHMLLSLYDTYQRNIWSTVAFWFWSVFIFRLTFYRQTKSWKNKVIWTHM